MSTPLMRASLLGLLLLSMPLVAAAQQTIADGYHAMYNLQFDEAHRIFADWQRAHPDDAFAAVSDAAAYLFTEFNRLHILEMEFFLDDRDWEEAGETSGTDEAVPQLALWAIDSAALTG